MPVVFSLLSLVFVCLLSGVSMAQSPSVRKSQLKEQIAPPKADEATQATKILPVSRPGFRDGPEAASFANVCETLFVSGLKDLKLGKMENRLLCGDGVNDSIGRPWSEIPPNEKSYFLKGFLQTRGYHHPDFIQDGDRLYLRIGPVSTLNKLRLLGGPPSWDPPERRFLIGEPLTPSLLNDTESWSLGLIKDEGYACAENSMQADPDTGEGVVFLRTGPQKRIRFLEHTGDQGVNENALNRYNAFLVGDLYRDRLVALTRRRTLDDGFLQTLVMTTKCGPGDELTVVRDVSLGPPRTVRVGAGYSSEQGPLLKATVRQARIGESANNAQASLKASYAREDLNSQSLTASFRWFYLPGESRYAITPTFEIRHYIDSSGDVRSISAGLLHTWTFDTSLGHYDLRAGPGLISEDKERSVADHLIKAGYVEIGGRWTDHDFEWFNTSPRTGSYIDLTALLAMRHLGSGFTGQKLQAQGEKLWTIGNFDPPLFILGARFGFSTVLAPDVNALQLPSLFLTRLGGDPDLRGYDFRSLPSSMIDAVTSINGSLEGRLHDVLFKVADIFSFVDVGALGTQGNAQFDKPLFWSPGAGIRYESPVGVLRLYLARRFTTGDDEGAYDKALRVGVTFGQEF